MFPNSSRNLVVVALAIGACTAARADGPYVGADLGHPQYSNSINGIGGGDTSNNGSVAAKLYGGYAFTPNWSLEGGVFRLGHAHDGISGDTVNSRGLFVDGVGTYAFAPQWSVLGRVGVAEARFTTTLGNDSSSGVKAGAGIQYDLTKQVGLRVQYERYHFFNAFDAKPNVGEFSAGIKFSF